MNGHKKILESGRIRDIFRSIPCDLMIVNLEYGLIWWNREVPQLPEAPVKCYEILFRQKAPCPECPLNYIKDTSRGIHSSIVSIEDLDDMFLVNLAPLPSSTKEYLVTHQKITPLMQEWAHLKTIHNTLPVGILITDNDLKIQYTNDEFFKLFPFLSMPLLGKDLRLIVSRHIPPFPKKMLDFFFALSSNKCSSERFEFTSANIRYIEVQCVPLGASFPKTASEGFIFLFQDRTEESLRNLLERQQQAHSEMTSFASSLFRTLEPSVKRLQRLSSKASIDNTSLQNLHREINQFMIKLESLHRFFGQKSRKEWGSVNLHDVLQKVIKHLSTLLTKKNIKLKTHFTRHLKPIEGSRTLMHQCIQSVLVNAVESMEPKIQETGSHYVPRIEVITRMQGSIIELTIKDNGDGMEEEQCAKACQPGYTTKNPSQHAGMGLFLCETVLHFMGGSLELSSVKDVGTKVVMRIPANPPIKRDERKTHSIVPPSHSYPPQKQKKAFFPNCEIWLLGDRDSTTDVIRKFLLNLGATVKGIYDFHTFQKMEASPRTNFLYILNVTDWKQTLPFLSMLGEKHQLEDTLILAPEEVLPHLKGRTRNTGVHLLKKPFPMQSLVESLTSLMGK